MASDYWQRRPDFVDSDERKSVDHPVDHQEQLDGQGDTESINQSSSSYSFDYLHFVQFLGVRNIQIINYDELEFETGAGEQVGKGFAMQVSLACWKGELVAVKAARTGDMRERKSPSRPWTTEKWLNDLYFELQIMSHRPLCEHPNIVQLLGISFSNNQDGQLYPALVVEPACREFADLTRFVLSHSEDIEPDLAAHLISDIADGISVLHVYGVVHGDVKPDNVLIFLTGDGPHYLTAKICDFGFCGSQFSEDSPRGGTPAWSAPECSPTAPKSFHEYRNKHMQDIYSFGLVVAFVLLRRRPTVSMILIAAESIVGDLERLNPEYPRIRQFKALLRQCLFYVPSARLSSLSEVRNSICW
jgi:serine/threonine protein kinase